MSPGATFERVYLALKASIFSGELRPGEQLDPRALGEDLASSITPVRDALHRLVGERLVEAPRNDGFRVPLLSEASLRHLYGWNQELLALALRGPPAPSARSAPSEPAGMAELALAIAQRHPNPEIAFAVAQLNGRMAAVRAQEPALVSGIDAEMRQIRDSFEAGDAAALRRALATSHRRRLRIVPQLVEVLAGTQPA